MSFTPPKVTTMTLAPGASVAVDGPGIFARFTEATGPLKLAFDLGSPFATDVGLAYECDLGESFSRVTVENPGAAAVTFTLVTGRMRVIDNRFTLIANRIGTLAQDGTDGTGIVPPAGAAGIRGWLSGIYDALAGGTINIVATGFSTEVTLAAAKAVLDAIKARADLLASEAKLEQVRALLAGTLAVSGPQTDTQFRASTIPTTLTDVPDVPVAHAAVTVVAAANATRKKIIVCNPSATYSIRVGTSLTAANRGAIVPPSGSIELETSAPVSVYQSSGGTMNIPVLFTVL